MPDMADRPGDPTRTAAQQAGDAAEELVASRLAEAGWTVLARNVHVGRHELDLVAIDPGPPAALVVIEVRWRAGRDFGLPEETVDHRKRARVRAAAYGLLDRGSLPTVGRAAIAVAVRSGRRGEPGGTGCGTHRHAIVDGRTGSLAAHRPRARAERRPPCYTPARSGA